MPELPEVETTMRGITPHIVDQNIEQFIIRQHQLRWPIPSHLTETLLNQKVIAITRRGKYLLLQTTCGTILLHLGMSGHLRILASDVHANKHDHVDIVFANQKMLRFTDPRRFGAVLWIPDDPCEHALLKHLGPEPLTKYFHGDYLYMRAQNKKIAVKKFVMDNKVVTGVGNIYATEALFAANIHPEKSVAKISQQKWHDLADAIKIILRDAIKRGGTTLKDFLKSDGKPGYFANQLKVYGRDGLPCVNCDKPLLLMQMNNRATVYCKHCQR